MKCNAVKSKLNRFLDESLLEHEARAIEAHISECDVCWTAWSELRSTQPAFDDQTLEQVMLAGPRPLPPDFTKQVMERIEAERPQGANVVVPWLRQRWSKRQYASVAYAMSATMVVVSTGNLLFLWTQSTTMIAEVGVKSQAYWDVLRAYSTLPLTYLISLWQALMALLGLSSDSRVKLGGLRSMTSENQSASEIQGICSSCGRPIIGEGIVEVNDQQVCKGCLEARFRKPTRKILGLMRFALSAVPGLGHLYMGMFTRGIQFAAITILGSVFLNALFFDSEFALLLVFGMVFLSIFDAREMHLRIEQGLHVEDKGLIDLKTFRLDMAWNSKYVGYGLVGVGGIVLYNTVVRDILRLLVPYQVYVNVMRSANGLMVSILTIGLGLYLLRRGIGNSKE